MLEDQTCGAAVREEVGEEEAVVARPQGAKEEASPLREEGENGGVDNGKGEGGEREFEEEEEKADSGGKGGEGEGTEEEGEAVAADTGLMDAL